MTEQPLPEQTLREQLAAQEHARWASWMDYQFSRGTFNPDGTWTMPAWAVERWQRQAASGYVDLSEAEKNSDRYEADNTLQLLQTYTAPAPRILGGPAPGPVTDTWRRAVMGVYGVAPFDPPRHTDAEDLPPILTVTSSAAVTPPSPTATACSGACDSGESGDCTCC